MRVTSLLFLIVMLLSFTAMAWASEHEHGGSKPGGGTAVEKEEAEAIQIYHCPMNCSDWMTTDKDAECPVCGMKVEAYEKLYACPMKDSNFVTDDKDAECPKCGMTVTELKEVYVYPDHPDVIIVNPDGDLPDGITKDDLVKKSLKTEDPEHEEADATTDEHAGCAKGSGCGH